MTEMADMADARDDEAAEMRSLVSKQNKKKKSGGFQSMVSEDQALSAIGDE